MCREAGLPAPQGEAIALGMIITAVRERYAEHVQKKLIDSTQIIIDKLMHEAISAQNRLAIIRFYLTSRA